MNRSLSLSLSICLCVCMNDIDGTVSPEDDEEEDGGTVDLDAQVRGEREMRERQEERRDGCCD